MLLPSKIKMFMEEKGFSGKDLREILSDEEQKLVEPLMGNNNYAVYYANASRDQRLFYVGEITEEIEKEAIASAVKKGRIEAKALAEAAGLKLGKNEVHPKVSFDGLSSAAASQRHSRPSNGSRCNDIAREKRSGSHECRPKSSAPRGNREYGFRNRIAQTANLISMPQVILDGFVVKSIPSLRIGNMVRYTIDGNIIARNERGHGDRIHGTSWVGRHWFHGMDTSARVST